MEGEDESDESDHDSLLNFDEINNSSSLESPREQIPMNNISHLYISQSDQNSI